jgi:predicted MPP superfamily phosphohydrolase
MPTTALKLLVIGDVHYTSDEADAAAAPPERNCLLGLELVRRAIEVARIAGGFDAIALVGDLVNDGSLPSAADDLVRLRETIRLDAGDAPVFAIPGNHDGPADRVLREFGCRPGVSECDGYRVVLFADAYREQTYATRRQEDLRLMDELARQGGGPIIALQHNPMHPAIDSGYPFMLTNNDDALAGYARAGVLLSISGHFHRGQPLHEHDGVLYYTAPALCEAPHRCTAVTLRGRDVDVKRLSVGEGAAL